jgi:hypothetical protein
MPNWFTGANRPTQSGANWTLAARSPHVVPFERARPYGHDVTGTDAPDSSGDAVPVTSASRLASPRTDAKTVGMRVLKREREQFSGMRFFLGFFGWLTATGLTVLLLAVVAGVGALVGVQYVGAQGVQAASIGSVIALLVVLFIAYFAGGYVAGRMARFSGLKQGLAVWLWALIIAVIVGVVGAIAGTRAGLAGQLSSIPQLPFSASQMTIAGVASAVAVIVITLLGALLGGIVGMRYHRRVDRAGIAATVEARP